MTKHTAANLRAIRAHLRTATTALHEAMRTADGVLLGSDQGIISEAHYAVLSLEARVHRALGELEQMSADDAWMGESHLGRRIARALADGPSAA
jgi:hypothetical protein